MVRPKISSLHVVVYCSGKEQQIRECVEQVLANTPKTANILFLADNVSKALTNDLLHLGRSHKRVTGGSIGMISQHVHTGMVQCLNRAFATITSQYVCIVESDVLVTHNWLEKLYDCILSESSLGAVAPLTNDSIRQGICSADLVNQYGYRAIADLIAKTADKTFPRVTSVDTCPLFSRNALLQIGGFIDLSAPIVDICHRIRKKGFGVAIADHVFVRSKGSTIAYMEDDKRFFDFDPLKYIRSQFEKNAEEINISVVSNRVEKPVDNKAPAECKERVNEPNILIKKPQLTAQKTIRIMSPSDTDQVHPTWWGDHWVREDMLKSFAQYDWTPGPIQGQVDVSLLLKGGNYFETDAKIRLAWIYSHPNDKEGLEKALSPKTDIIYTLSSQHANLLAKSRPDVKILLPATSKRYCPRKDEPQYDILIVGNGLKPERVRIAKILIRRGYKIKIVGAYWNGHVNKRFLLCPYWDNERYSELFNSAKITLYIHNDDMRINGFVAVRVLDAIACSDSFVISDKNEGFKDLALETIPQYEDDKHLFALLDRHLSRDNDHQKLLSKWRHIIYTNHSFDARIQQIQANVEELASSKKIFTRHRISVPDKIIGSQDLKIFVPFEPKSKKGGAYSFMSTLIRELRHTGVDEISYNDIRSCNVALLVADLGHIATESLKSMRIKRGLKVCHRLDGSFHQHGLDKNNKRDARVHQLNELTDVIIYQSIYGKTLLESSGIADKNKPSVIIYNGTDRGIFKPIERKLSIPIRLISANCSKIAIKRVERLNDFVSDHTIITHVGYHAPSVQLHDSIKVLAPMSARELNDLYEGCHAFIQTGDNDTCPNVVIEALSAGMPIIYWRSGGTPELVENAGLAVDDFESPEDLLRYLIINYEELCNNALQRAQQFDIKVVAQKYMAVLRKLLEGGYNE